MRILASEPGPVTQALTQTADGGRTRQLVEPLGIHPSAPDDVTIGDVSGGVFATQGPIVGSFTPRGTHGATPIANDRRHSMVLDPGNGWIPCSAHSGYLAGATIRCNGLVRC